MARRLPPPSKPSPRNRAQFTSPTQCSRRPTSIAIIPATIARRPVRASPLVVHARIACDHAPQSRRAVALDTGRNPRRTPAATASNNPSGTVTRMLIRRTGCVTFVASVVLLPLACGGSGPWSRDRPPTSLFSCSDGEVPVAFAESASSRGTFGWACGTPPPSCANGEEIVWVRTGNVRGWQSESAYEVNPKCTTKCLDDEDRFSADLCLHRRTAEEEAADRNASVDFRRKQHPGAACMYDCSTAMRRCVVNCNSTDHSPACLSRCQQEADQCTPSCQLLPP
jgi:hypothetical protein